MAIDLAWIELRGGPLGMVDAVRILLRLQADSALLPIDRPALSVERAVQVIARVDLNAGLVRKNLHRPAAGRMAKRRNPLQIRFRVPATHEKIMVDSSCMLAVRARRQGINGISKQG